MTHEIEFRRDIDNILASATTDVLFVVAGWTIAISRLVAIEYAKSFDKEANRGFVRHDGKVVLSHGDGKITLSNEEASAVIELIQTAYGPF